MGFFEDMIVGAEEDLGSHLFTAEDITRFARAYDPQRFHLSDEAAAETFYGRLSASGWHTAAVWMKLMVAHMGRRMAEAKARGEPVAPLGPSPGFEDMSWSKPVFAGDVISYRLRITDKRALASRPGWGLVTMRNEGRNAAGEVVFAFTGKVLARLRDGEAAAA